MENAILLKDLTDQERMMFQVEYSSMRKDTGVGVLLAIFLGAFGAHHFYLGRVGFGVLYVICLWLIFWTLVWVIIGFFVWIIPIIECFFMPDWIRAYNAKAAEEIVLKLKAIRS